MTRQAVVATVGFEFGVCKTGTGFESEAWCKQFLNRILGASRSCISRFLIRHSDLCRRVTITDNRITWFVSGLSSIYFLLQNLRQRTHTMNNHVKLERICNIIQAWSRYISTRRVESRLDWLCERNMFCGMCRALDMQAPYPLLLTVHSRYIYRVREQKLSLIRWYQEVLCWRFSDQPIYH